MNVHLPGANIIVARVKGNGFQKAEAFAAITSKGRGTAEFHSPEERHVYYPKASERKLQET